MCKGWDIWHLQSHIKSFGTVDEEPKGTGGQYWWVDTVFWLLIKSCGFDFSIFLRSPHEGVLACLVGQLAYRAEIGVKLSPAHVDFSSSKLNCIGKQVSFTLDSIRPCDFEWEGMLRGLFAERLFRAAATLSKLWSLCRTKSLTELTWRHLHSPAVTYPLYSVFSGG